MDPLDGRIGEAWSGEVPNGSHVNVVIGRRGSPTAAAVVGALASPRPGHLPFLVCLEHNTVVLPLTVCVNKVAAEVDSAEARLVWGAAQIGIAQGVLDAVADGVLDAAEVPELVLLVAVWVDPAASDETSLRVANREATRAAIVDAVSLASADEVRALAGRREEARNAYYGGT
jgi:5,6,7,8-tetrahydromethanopterin hydro-lyase